MNHWPDSRNKQPDRPSLQCGFAAANSDTIVDEAPSSYNILHPSELSCLIVKRAKIPSWCLGTTTGFVLLPLRVGVGAAVRVETVGSACEIAATSRRLGRSRGLRAADVVNVLLELLVVQHC